MNSTNVKTVGNGGISISANSNGNTAIPNPATQIFGVSLEDLFARENGNVPVFYLNMINFLQETGYYSFLRNGYWIFNMLF